MTAKEYLVQLRKLKIKVKNKKEQCNTLRENIEYIRGQDYSTDKVQTSVTDQMASTMAKLIDLESETLRLIARYELMYDEGINRIHSLSKPEYIFILQTRYLDDDYAKRRFESIACDLNYSYDRTIHLHGEALQEFERKFLR